jgi:hypothetical protein
MDNNNISVKQTKTEKYPNRWEKGVSGNPNGRPRKPEVEQLRIALDEACKKHNKSFIAHLIDRAYKNDTVAIALAKKLLPDQIEHSGEVAAKPFDIIIKVASKDSKGEEEADNEQSCG